MAPSRLLKARLDRIYPSIGEAQRVDYDLSYLEGCEIDRLRELSGLIEAEPDEQLLMEFEEIVTRCPVLPRGEMLQLRPRFPQSLIRYWRGQGFSDPRLPRGNYSSHSLSYASRDRLIELCAQYGWDHETGETNGILPIDRWEDAHLVELVEILREALGHSTSALADVRARHDA